MDPRLSPSPLMSGTPPPSFPMMPLVSSMPGSWGKALVGKGKRAEPRAFWRARSMEPRSAPAIRTCSTRWACLGQTDQPGPSPLGRCVQGQSGKSEWLQPVLSQCHNSESYLLIGLYSSISHFLRISLFVVYGR